MTLGWIGERAPRLVAVQSTGCAPIVRAFSQGARRAQPWPDAHTVAFGITVPAPLGDELILDALYATGGTAVAVTTRSCWPSCASSVPERGCWCARRARPA